MFARNSSGSEAQIRAFIAIELPPDIKTVLKKSQTHIEPPGNNQVKWVDPVNIHLTLKFLGNISASQIEPVNEAMQAAAVSTRPFHLDIQTAGAFPDLKRAQVVWIGLKGDLDILLNLQKVLDTNLGKLGFTPENRPFSPHLTIGRVRESATNIDKQDIGKSVSSLQLESGLGFDVHSINLMQSRLFPSGPVYTCLKSAKI